MIIFLDFDGVLHPDPCYRRDQLFEHLPRFESILRDFPCVDVVISSSWRETLPWRLLVAVFSDDIKHRILGSTPSLKNTTWNKHLRHDEILAYLSGDETNQNRPYLVIDDRPEWFPENLECALFTHPDKGFDDKTEDELRSKLEKMYGSERADNWTSHAL